jgi:heterodisulfide reductase subunit A-like polyferredoxin
MAGKDSKISGSVMIVGGGIGGIQASLDLAESGFFVYLVEKSPAIGGIMSQLDKTFPTNDCSMCIISPKLVEVNRHLNIELLTNSDLLDLKGEAGRFQARVLKRPRYVDLTKCTSCGECAKVCPITLGNEFDQFLSERRAAFKKYPQASPAGYGISKRGIAPCKAECPAHISVQGYVALTAEGRFQEALKLIKKENPLPAICGRVCHHPCEGVCTRGQLDEPVAIDSIKRYLADLDLASETRFVPEVKERKEEQVAIIGSGPSGLACAYYLAQEGYPVTIFEKQPVAGGMLSLGIPEYRLPRDVIQAEVQVILDMGVTLKTGVSIGQDVTMAELRQQGFKAFFLGIGAQECLKLGVEGEDLEGVYPGLDFLRRVNLGETVHLGDRVAVVGGGNVAMDAVRTALRTGSKTPFIVYRRSLEEMPANEEEIEECREEGIEIHTLVNPTRVIGENGRVKALELIRMELGEPDASGRRRPVPVKGSEFVIEVDAVIAAIGQESDWACLGPECACTLTDRKTMQVDPVTMQTSDPDIFAGGDAVTGPRTVIEAIEAGKQAAVSIDRYIRGQDLAEGRSRDWTPAKDVPLTGHEHAARTPMPRLDPTTRTSSFAEVQQGFSEADAVEEAKRCLACGICSECYRCVEACLAGAIFHDDQPEERLIDVGSVILCPGAVTFDPAPMDAFYHYKQHPNVVTSIEFERILSASGPYLGHLMRPSDQKEPKKIAWLQCVGSRDQNRCGNSFCSYMCCMYAIKEAVIAKEHSKVALETAIFYMDMRTFGKDYEKYYTRAEKEHGVRFIRARLHTIHPIPGTDDLLLRYSDEHGNMQEEVFDMLVLSVGVKPDQATVELAERLGVELNKSHFAMTSPFAPVHTSRPGVYACGIFQAPKDIPSTVADASAAACAASEWMSEARWRDTRVRQMPEEKDVEGQPPRIGVFICNCGINIGGVIDVPAVTEYAATLPGVVFADHNLFTCSQDTQEQIKAKINEFELNRIVVASCSPRTHEPLFMETLQACGLNKYLFEMANIRDQNSWVHASNPVFATEKAKDLVRMAVSRAGLLKPLMEKKISMEKRALIIGGGVAGMNAALGLARQGFEAVLVEKEAKLGGLSRDLTATIEGQDIPRYLTGLIQEVMENDKIEVLTESLIVGFSGVKGNYVTEIMVGPGMYERRIRHGVIVLATGAREYQPTEYLYGQDPRVKTQLELSRQLDLGGAEGLSQVVMIQCVGSRNEQNPNCSRVCCQTAVKNALHIKDLNPETEVYVLYRDMRTYGLLEDYYTLAREKGVLFFRYNPEDPPRVTISGDDLLVTFKDHVLEREVDARADVVALSAGMVPEDTEELASILKVPRNAEGYFMEAHVKLRPVDMASDGIFLCGTAHSPKLISESISQALAAAARAATLLAQDTITLSAVTAQVNPDLCAACLVCVMSCPYEVPRINEQGVSEIDPALCHGCGVCVAECPAKAIELNWYEDDQILCKLDALLEGVL